MADASPSWTYTVSVRSLCEFTAKRGSLDRRFTPSATALEGQAGQLAVLARRSPGYETELPLEGRHGHLRVRGRADGFEADVNRLEEIKTIRGPIDLVPENRRALHWAQLETYGALIAADRGLAELELALSLIHISLKQSHAPWLTANLALREPLLQRPGAPLSWDNVRYGSTALGYVDARHQSLDPTPRAPLLTAYLALPETRRGELLKQPWQHWAGVITQELALVHPDLPGKLERIDLCRFGHAMSIPTPGLRGSAELAALNAQRGRLVFAHGDLGGYSVFEEAYTAGVEAAARLSL